MEIHRHVVGNMVAPLGDYAVARTEIGTVVAFFTAIPQRQGLS